MFKRILSPLRRCYGTRRQPDKALAASIVEVNAAVAGFIAKGPRPHGRRHSLRSPAICWKRYSAAADEKEPDRIGIDDAQVMAGNVLMTSCCWPANFPP
jgi:hypothetical protein